MATGDRTLLTKLADFLTHTNARNPHGTTKSDLGLGNVDNTSDANKPVSTATQTAINEASSANTTAINNHANNKNNPHSVTASQAGALPNTAKVNGKALSENPSLNASDVGAVPTTRKVAGKALSSDVTLYASDVGAVPTTRKVNGKALSSDITLSADGVGAVPISGGTMTGDLKDKNGTLYRGIVVTGGSGTQTLKEGQIGIVYA